MAAFVSSFDLQKIFKILPSAKAVQVSYALNENSGVFGVTSKVALAHSIAQAAVESYQFTKTEENLNYSARALVATFKKFSLTEKKGKLLASEFARKPESIANAAYGNRKDLGNTEVGDGWKYRGRGFLQLTGKYNYQEFQKFYNKNYTNKIDIVANPGLIAADFNLAIISSLWFFKNNVLRHVSIHHASVRDVTRRVNAKLLDLKKRESYFIKAMESFCYYDFSDYSSFQYVS